MPPDPDPITRAIDIALRFSQFADRMECGEHDDLTEELAALRDRLERARQPMPGTSGPLTDDEIERLYDRAMSGEAWGYWPKLRMADEIRRLRADLHRAPAPANVSDEDVERVARHLFAAYEHADCPDADVDTYWMDRGEGGRDWWRATARAAIAAGLSPARVGGGR